MPTTSTPDLIERRLADPTERSRLVAAYVRGALPSDLVDAFETRLFDAPDLAADVAAEESLRDTLRSMRADDVLAPPQPAVQTFAALPPRRDRRIGFALAAGLLAGAVLPTLAWWHAEQRLELAAVPRASAGEAIAVFALSGARRLESAAPVQDVPLPAASRLALQVPAPNEDGPYRVRLVRDGGGEIAQAQVAQADDLGYVGFAFDTAGLGGARSATVVVDVRRGDAWTESGTYPLNFVAGVQRR